MNHGGDPFDELTAMFLTDPSSEASEGAPESEQESNGCSHAPSPGAGPGVGVEACVELLIVGHLPVRAGLWLTPYADAVARKAGLGGTALVRLDGDDPMLQVLRRDGVTHEDATWRTLREAIFSIAPTVRTWIVRPSIQAEPAELVTCPSDRVAILSSADQAAVVNAYRLVKELVDSARHTGRPVPKIRLSVIGADDEAAADVARRLNRTTMECLELEVPLGQCLPRIDASIRAGSLRSFPGQTRPPLDEVLGWIRSASEVRAEEPPPPPEVEVEVEIREIEVPDHDSEDAILTDEDFVVPDEPVYRAELRASDIEAPSVPDITRLLKLRPQPASTLHRPPAQPPREPQVPRSTEPQSLSHYVAGLKPLTPRPPKHDAIELAVDAQGNLHLLGRDDALRDLPPVRAWAKDHRELLALACPDAKLNAQGAIIAHVFTDNPQSVSDLHASDLHLHVLAPVDVAGHRGWYAAPLNQPDG